MQLQLQWLLLLLQCCGLIPLASAGRQEGDVLPVTKGACLHLASHSFNTLGFDAVVRLDVPLMHASWSLERAERSRSGNLTVAAGCCCLSSAPAPAWSTRPHPVACLRNRAFALITIVVVLALTGAGGWSSRHQFIVKDCHCCSSETSKKDFPPSCTVLQSAVFCHSVVLHDATECVSRP